MRTRSLGNAILALLLLGSINQAGATEGALGRPVTGMSVLPDAGIVPGEPVLIGSIAMFYIDGSIGGGREVPVAGKTTLGVNAEAFFAMGTIMKVWDTGTGRWNFASSFTLPYTYTKASAALSAGSVQGSRGDSTSDLYDITFSPIIAGYHFSEAEHVAVSLNIWAPTGKYDKSKLSSPSLNTWTFIPQLAYTKLFSAQNLELDVVAGLEFYTRNSATDYQNAPLFTLDTMLLKRFTGGAGVGLIVGTTQQIGKDSGPLADRLNGFRGHDWAVGPIVTYDTKVGTKNQLSLSLRWVPTVSSTNRLDSTRSFMGTATLVF